MARSGGCSPAPRRAMRRAAAAAAAHAALLLLACSSLLVGGATGKKHVEGKDAPHFECKGGNVWHECGRECFCPTDVGDRDVLVCANIACRPGCYCPEGKLRADSGECFRQKECPDNQVEGFLWLSEDNFKEIV